MDIRLMAALGWGSSGPDVERLQQLLKAAGFYYGPVDSTYGALVYSAVSRFQASAGLAVDGIAGPDTMAVLEGYGGPSPSTTVTSGEVAGDSATASGQAMSLHIGINRVDAAQYSGWDGLLSGCESDAQTMAAIAVAEGFTPRQLLTTQATSTNILGEIRRAAQALMPGGTFLLTYAGHGGQFDDPTGAEETDKKDETWLAYDRQILDDELEAAFADFQGSVDIVQVSDSCHSGTVFRFSEGDRELQAQFAELKESFYQDLAVPRPGPGDPPFAGFPRPALPTEGGRIPTATRVGTGPGGRSDDTGSSTPVFAPEPISEATTRGSGATPEPGYVTPGIPLAINELVNETQRPVLAQVKAQAKSRGAVRARGVLLAGCADNQLSGEIGGAGLFTTALNRVWSGGTFKGDYSELLAQVLSQMGPTQTPQLSTFGVDPDPLRAKTPFKVGTSRGEVETGTVKVWLGAFIPKLSGKTEPAPGRHAGQTMLRGPIPGISDCFLTDNRGFSNDIRAPSRMHSEIEIDVTGPRENFQWHNCDSTIEIDCEDGDVECSARGDTSRMRFKNLRGDLNSSIKVDLAAAANNPCFAGSPDIDYVGTFTIDIKNRTIEFDGSIDEFPAFESYVSVDGGAPLTLFQTLPLAGRDPWNLPGDASRPQAGRVRF